MQVAEPLVRSWKARLELGFTPQGGRTVLSHKQHDGPLVVQKALYPEGDAVCHAIVVHPPGGIAGGDELELASSVAPGAAALLTTPGATKWYRSAGPQASQRIAFDVQGALEWLPQETIVFDGALALSTVEADLARQASLVGWEIVCLGRAGSGERFRRGSYRFSARVRRAGHPLWLERGRIDGGSAILQSPAGLAGHAVFGTLYCAFPDLKLEHLSALRKVQPEDGRGAATRLPGMLLARYLGDSSEAARRYFMQLWHVLRPALAGREAVEPRIWRT
jgi:urease accessory protein